MTFIRVYFAVKYPHAKEKCFFSAGRVDTKRDARYNKINGGGQKGVFCLQNGSFAAGRRGLASFFGCERHEMCRIQRPPQPPGAKTALNRPAGTSPRPAAFWLDLDPETSPSPLRPTLGAVLLYKRSGAIIRTLKPQNRQKTQNRRSGQRAGQGKEKSNGKKLQ